MRGRGGEWKGQVVGPAVWARVRWRVRLGRVIGFLMLVCIPGLMVVNVVAMPVFGIDSLSHLPWQILGVMVIVLGGGTLAARLDDQVDEAVWADGHLAVGRIADVITEVAFDGEATVDGETDGRYRLLIVADVAGGVTIRRTVTRTEHGPGPRVGETILFRHNTMDPDNETDVLEERPRVHSSMPTPAEDVDDAARWIGRATTWRARWRLRRWSWLEENSVRMMLFAIAGMFLMIPGTFIIVAVLDGESSGFVLVGAWVALTAALLLFERLHSVAGDRLSAARSAITRFDANRADDTTRPRSTEDD